MAKFCNNCGAQLDDAAKFCAGCGAQAAPPVQPQPAPTQQPYIPQQQPYAQQQTYIPQQPPQYQYGSPIPAAPKKKKNKLPLILSLAGVAVAGIVVAVILLVNGVTGILENTAKADYYEIGNDKIPSVKLALGEERRVVGVNTSISNGATTRTIEYQVAGSEQNREMFEYFTYLCDKDGFLNLTDIIFSGPSGTGVVGRNSVDDGYEIQLRINYHQGGYTITILKQPGGITPVDPTPDQLSGGETDGPWVGLWRYEGHDGVELYNLKEDGTLKFEGYYTDGSGDVVITGNYTMSDGNMRMTGLTLNGEPYDDLEFAFQLGGDTAVINNETCARVPTEYAAAVLADPLAPYPPNAGGNNGADPTGNGGNLTNSLTADLLRMFDDGTFHMKMRTLTDEGDWDVDVYAMGGQITLLITADGMDIRTVYKNEKSYMIIDEYQSVTIYDADPDNEVPGLADTENLTFVRQDSGDFNGGTYQYDEYTGKAGQQLFYYVDGGHLIGIRVISVDGETGDVEILAFDKNVPDSVFDIPEDYEVFDMAE